MRELRKPSAYAGHDMGKRTLVTTPLQKPVPLSNQSLFLSSYTLTRFRSLAGGGATFAITGGGVSTLSG
jgi:hypothetical protein